MNRLHFLFSQKPSHLLSLYFTAGYPQREDTGTILLALQQAGVDVVEIGIPCAHPFADGETIQRSHQQALQNGMNLRLLFDQLADCRPQIDLPIFLMGYVNSIIAYGLEAFCQRCKAVEVDGILLADLPFSGYEDHFKTTFERHGLSYIPLITPQTPEPIIRRIDQTAKGFIYMVSSLETTGSLAGITPDMLAYFKRIERMHLKSPRLIGFGIKDQPTFETACAYADGAIIGSAFIRALSDSSRPLSERAAAFVNGIRPLESPCPHPSWWDAKATEALSYV